VVAATLTPSQLEAIDYEGRNVQLIACVGAGKTEVVAGSPGC